jgi:hypothetical protein
LKQWNKNTNAITEAQKLKERKQVMRTLGLQNETSSLTWVLLLFFLLLHEANNVAAKKKARDTERDTHTESARDRNRKGGRQADNDDEKGGGEHS